MKRHRFQRKKFFLKRNMYHTNDFTEEGNSVRLSVNKQPFLNELAFLARLIQEQFK